MKNRFKKLQDIPFQFEAPEDIVNRKYPKNRPVEELLEEVE